MKSIETMRTLANLASVLGGEMALRVGNLGAAIIIGRLYGPIALGVYSATLAFATLLVTVADNGLQISTVAELSRQPLRMNSVFSTLYATKLMLLAVATAIALAAALFTHTDRVLLLITGLVAAKVMVNSVGQLHFGVLKALNRMRVIGVIQFGHFCILSGSVAFGYLHRSSLALLLSLLLIAQISEVICSGTIVTRSGIRPCRTTLLECWRIVRTSMPVGISYIAAAFILRIDVLIATVLFSAAEVGHFAAADNGIVVVYVCAWLAGSVMLPDFVRCHNASRPEFGQFVGRRVRQALSACIPVSLAGAAVAPALTVWFYGRNFQPAGPLASVMALAIPLIVANALYFHGAIASRARAVYLGAYLSTAVAAVILDGFLGWRLGLIGIAWAVLARELLMLAIFVFWASRFELQLCAEPLPAVVSLDEGGR